MDVDSPVLQYSSLPSIRTPAGTLDALPCMESNALVYHTLDYRTAVPIPIAVPTFQPSSLPTNLPPFQVHAVDLSWFYRSSSYLSSFYRHDQHHPPQIFISCHRCNQFSWTALLHASHNFLWLQFRLPLQFISWPRDLISNKLPFPSSPSLPLSLSPSLITP